MGILHKTINDITVKDAVKVYVLFQTLFVAKRFVVAVTSGIANGTADKISDNLKDITNKVVDTMTHGEKVSNNSEDVIDVDDSQEIQPL